MKSFSEKRQRIPFYIFLFILFIFFIKGVVFKDPDFWWRLRDGEMFLREGVVKFDPYSYTMPTFHFVDHAWLQSIFFYILNLRLGSFALSLIYSLLAILAFNLSIFVLDKKERDSINRIFKKSVGRNYGVYTNAFVFLGASLLFSFFGVRVQVLSWFLWAVLLNVLLREDLFSKFGKFLPFLFILWVNVHGSFLLGIGILGIILIYRFFKKKRGNANLLWIFGLSLLSTLFNPYGTGVWREVLSSAMDTKLSWTIAEWAPSFYYANFVMINLFCVSILFVFKYWKKYKTEEKVIYLILLIEAIGSRRHLPLWSIIAVPVAAKGTLYFFRELKSTISKNRFYGMYKYFFYISIIVVLVQAVFEEFAFTKFSEGKFYPKNAVQSIIEANYNGRLFSEYGWGGYLIYKFPDQKVFIDGRMPSWREGSGKESYSAIEEYYNIIGANEDSGKKISEYGIRTILWPANEKEDLFGGLTNFLENSFIPAYLRSNKNEFIPFLKDNGWCEIYRDDYAVILKDSEYCEKIGKK